ncbi:MAG: RluA family pseudouridine synthase [Candidatus Omnitrophica bacterium]|nr:RluA family pseudouridine synthase [Candidatus Omnitrophota bacterium]
MTKFEPFTIVFEDNEVIVLNKIAKLLVVPSPKGEKYTVTSLLAQRLKQPVYPCHRLDRETTGLLLYAKNKKIQQEIMNAFRQRQISKKYLAFVKGKMKQCQGTLRGYILDTEGRRFGERPKEAKTNYRVMQITREFSVVELEPVTGRTNQLRIQLAKIGNPILGERKYAYGRDFTIRFKRLALHASSLAFTHPVSKKHLAFTIELPKDMHDFLERFAPPGTSHAHNP